MMTRRELGLMTLATMLSKVSWAQQPSAPLPSLAGVFKGRLSIGAAVEPNQLTGPEALLLGTQFNSLVAENAMKPSSLQPVEGSFNFGPADEILEFARLHNMRLRGHALVWHRSVPDWFWVTNSGDPVTRELLLARLEAHIHTVVSHFKGSVYCWDVVNEVIDPTAGGLRQNKWLQIIGPEYIERAFAFAREADPDAVLFLNDYGTTQMPRLRALTQLIASLQAKGVPVGGLGHQMHVSVYYPPMQEVDAALSAFESLGLENEITELDMSLYKWSVPQLLESPRSLLQLQARQYAALLEVVLKHPRLRAMTFWGISDNHTSRSTPDHIDAPLLFDTEFKPKPAFWSVIEVAR